MVDDIIYWGPSPVGNLKNQDPRGLGIIICHIVRMTQPPLWGGIQKTMRAIGCVEQEESVIRKYSIGDVDTRNICSVETM